MTRHASLAEQLNTLLEYRSRPEGNAETVKTNFTTVVANDNNPEDTEGLHTERRISIRPTVGEIVKSVKTNDVERNKDGKVVRIGSLRFSDGTQTERAFRRDIEGKLVEFDAIMPVGAMLGTSDRQERVLGGDTISSNSAYTLVYGGRHPNKVNRKTKEARAAEVQAPLRTKADMRAEIAELPRHPITYCKKGFPWKPSNLRELFMGMEKGKKGESGSVAWEDISTHTVEREIWAETLAALSDGDKTTLDAAMTAKNMREIGEAHGFVGKRAERMGTKILRASNDNVSRYLKKYAA